MFVTSKTYREPYYQRRSAFVPVTTLLLARNFAADSVTVTQPEGRIGHPVRFVYHPSDSDCTPYSVKDGLGRAEVETPVPEGNAAHGVGPVTARK
jgi:hypothetical protein